MITQKQRVRFSKALDRLGNDEEIFVRVAEVVLEDAPPLLGGISSSIKQNRKDEVIASAHKLKGLLSTFNENSEDLDFTSLMRALTNTRDLDLALSKWQSLKPKVNALLDEIGSLVSR